VHDAPSVRGSIIANMLQEHDNPFTLYPYDTNYVIYTYTNHINKEAIQSYNWADNAKNDELKFQLSLAFPLWRGIAGDNSVLGASYTQKSFWQVSNSAESSPFRETNYEPQLFLAWATDYEVLGWTLREAEYGLNHQSNGRADPTSRSWNRVYARFMAQRGDWQVEVKPWYRIPENKDNDDNPDITKYMGYYQLKIGYAVGESVISVTSRYNWNTGYGGAELGWSYPITRHVRFYTQLFSGYGESLIDYNYKQTRVGIGIMMNDIM
jgi:phospholipase A1